MSLLAGQRLTSQMQALSKPRERSSTCWGLAISFHRQFEARQERLVERSPGLSGRSSGAVQDSVRKITDRLHSPINAGLRPPSQPKCRRIGSKTGPTDERGGDGFVPGSGAQNNQTRGRSRPRPFDESALFRSPKRSVDDCPADASYSARALTLSTRCFL